MGMFFQVYSAGIWGIDGFLISVEADIRDGLPGFILTGNLSQETREASERVRTALKNSGFSLPTKKVTINLAPADIRKDGTGYDLAIAASVLGACVLGDERDGQEEWKEEQKKFWDSSMAAGEVGLDGRVKPVRGVISLVLAARERGIVRCFLPKENVAEGELVEGIEIIPVEHLTQLWAIIKKPEKRREKLQKNAEDI